SRNVRTVVVWEHKGLRCNPPVLVALPLRLRSVSQGEARFRPSISQSSQKTTSASERFPKGSQHVSPPESLQPLSLGSDAPRAWSDSDVQLVGLGRVAAPQPVLVFASWRSPS